MADVFRELIKASAIENQLTGTVKLANEEKDPDYGVDDDVKLMSRERRQGGRCDRAAAPAAAGTAARAKMPPPAALSPEAAKQFEKLNRPLKPGGHGDHNQQCHRQQHRHHDGAAVELTPRLARGLTN